MKKKKSLVGWIHPIEYFTFEDERFDAPILCKTFRRCLYEFKDCNIGQKFPIKVRITIEEI